MVSRKLSRLKSKMALIIFYLTVPFLLLSYQSPAPTAIAQTVYRLSTGWTVRGSNPSGGGRYPASVQTCPGAHPASCTVVTASFSGVERPGSGAEPQPHLQCRSLKLGRAITLPALRVLVVCYRENLYLYQSSAGSIDLVQEERSWKLL